MLTKEGLSLSTSRKLGYVRGVSGESVAPWSFALATNQPPLHDVTPATTE